MTARQRRFIAEYLASGNGTQAAIRAGYSKHTAKEIASQNLTKPEIAAAIAEKQAEQVKRLEITADMIAAAAWEVAQRALDAVPVRDAKGKIVPGQWTCNLSAATPALALLAKRHREFSDKHEAVNPAEIEELARRYGLDPVAVLAEAEEIVSDDGARS